MRSLYALSALVVVFGTTAVLADDPNPDDIIGKWELTEVSAQLPKGSVFEFQKEGKLLVTVEQKAGFGTKKGEATKRTSEFKWSLAKSTMTFELPTKKSDTTEVTKLTKTELEFKDANGTVAKFKRQEPPKDKEKNKENKEKP